MVKYFSKLNTRLNVIDSGSINSINKNGVYYVTNAVTDKPNANGGIFIVATHPNGVGVSYYIPLSSTPYMYQGTRYNNVWTFIDVNDVVKMVTLSASYTLAANESKNVNFTSGSIPSGYTPCSFYVSATGNAKVIVRFANSTEVGLINLTNASISGTVGVKVLCIKSYMVS